MTSWKPYGTHLNVVYLFWDLDPIEQLARKIIVLIRTYIPKRAEANKILWRRWHGDCRAPVTDRADVMSVGSGSSANIHVVNISAHHQVNSSLRINQMETRTHCYVMLALRTWPRWAPCTACLVPNTLTVHDQWHFTVSWALTILLRFQPASWQLVIRLCITAHRSSW